MPHENAKGHGSPSKEGFKMAVCNANAGQQMQGSYSCCKLSGCTHWPLGLQQKLCTNLLLNLLEIKKFVLHYGQ